MRRILLHLTLVAAAVWAVGCGQGTRRGGDPSSGQQGSQGLFYNVTVAKPYGGVVTSDDGQINCGTLVSQNACSAVYLWAATPALSAAADADYSFQGWAGDCSGTGSCVLGTASSGADKTVAAVFQGTGPNAPPPPPADQTPGRLYGYVLSDDIVQVKVAGVSVSVNTVPPQTAKSTAGGAFVFEVPPGTYTVTAAAGAGFAGASNAGIVIPAVGDPTCGQGFYVPTAPYTQAGCMKQTNLVGAYTPPPVAGPSPFLVSAPQYYAGFGTTVTISCDANGYAWGSWRFVQTKGPVAVALSGSQASSDWTFTTPTIPELLAATVAADPTCVPEPDDPSDLICTPNPTCPNGAGNASPNQAVGCGVSNFYMEQRPRLVAVNKQQADEMTFTFACEVFDGPGFTGTKYTKTTTVQMASKYTGQPGDFVMDPPTIASSAGRVPSGVIVIADDYRPCAPGETPSAWPFTTSSAVICRPSYAWAFTGTAPAWNGGVFPTINGANTQNPWIKLPDLPAGTTSQSWALADDAYTNASISFTEAKWDSFENTCHKCHGADSWGTTHTTPEVVAEWKASKHNHIVIDGMSGTHYSSSCLPCHTVGYDPAANNGGWDDVAAAQTPPYALPDFTFLGGTDQIQFAAMPQAVQDVSNIQCQSCHGPASPATPGADTRAHTASASSKVCAACHDGGHHSIYSQWRKSPHGSLAGAQGEGPLHGTDQTHCARCHYAQGNSIYRKQLAALGNPDRFETKYGPVVTLAAGSVSKAARTQTTAGNVTVTVALPAGTTFAPGSQAVAMTFVAPDVGTITAPATWPAPGPFTSGIKVVTVAATGDSFTYSERANASSPAVTNAAATDTVQRATFPQPANATYDNVEPVGCQTCHEPHSLEMTISNAQTQGVGMLLAGGFRATNAGAGGVCVMCHNSRNGMVGGAALQHNDATPLTSANFGMTGPHSAAQADVYYAGNGYLLGRTAPAQPNYHQDPNWFPDTCADCHVKRFTAATQGKTAANHTFMVDANTCVSCHGAGVELSYRKTYVADRIKVYELVLANVLKGAGITAVGQAKTVAAGGLSKPDGSSIVTATLAGHGFVDQTYAAVSVNSADAGFKGGTYLITVVDANTFTFNDTRANATGAAIVTANSATVTGSFGVAGLGTLNAAAVSGDRPLTLTLTFGSTKLTSNIDYILNGTTPVLYSGSLSGGTRTYGKVAKSMYDFGLIENDKSSGVHNIPFVDAMLAAMVDPASYAPVGGVY